MLLRRSSALLLLLLFMPSCDDGGSTSTTDEHETLVAVSPDEFLGAVPCSSEPGGITRYVATLIDVSPEGAAGAAGAASYSEFILPSSWPIPCAETVLFSRVEKDRSYSALVDGYASEKLEPLTPGSPTMVDRETGAIVAPDWSTRCGDLDAVGMDAPAVAISRMTVTVRGCAPMIPTTKSPGTALLPLGTALENADISCDSLASVSVVESESVLLESAAVNCSTELEVEDLPSGKHELVVSSAHSEGGAGPTLLCTVSVPEGETATADCVVETETPLP